MQNSLDVFQGNRVHLIGIGGIGMSAIAKVLHHYGISVQGSDHNRNYITKSLEEVGLKIFYTHEASNISDADIIIISSAISDNNPELAAAKAKMHLKIYHRAEAVAFILRNYNTIAITGTHGKSTTTALVASIFINAKLDPLVINGAVINQFHSNVVTGDGNIAVVESDESDESFLTIPSTSAIITNMDADHLDHYGSVEKMIDSYRKFVLKTKNQCFVCNDHLGLKNLIKEIGHNQNIFNYGIHDVADITAHNIEFTINGMVFDVKLSDYIVNQLSLQNNSVDNIHLSLYGDHNVYNSLAAIGMGLAYGIDLNTIKSGLQNFQGVKRRLTKVGNINGALLFDDYAHHPSEIQATLKVGKNLASINAGKVIAVMQPHRYTRLENLMNEFANSFIDADIIILMPVYSAGEKEIQGINSDALNKLILATDKQSQVIYNYDELRNTLNDIAKASDIIIMMGAGDITDISYNLSQS